MKKVISMILPLVASSFLFGCGGDNQPKYFTVTFDAVDGTFDSEKTFTLDVREGTEIKKLIDVTREPKSDSSSYSFAYYAYSNDEILKYGDAITSDITLKAKYLYATSMQVSDLDITELSWKDIGGICTGGDPDKWFKIGATKTVNAYGVNHQIRIIGIHHDKITNLDQKAGLTFEFADVISKDNGPNNVEVPTCWDVTSGSNYDFPNSDLNEAVANIDLSYATGLEEVISKVDKQVACGKEYKIKTYSTKLFPLSWEEMGVVNPPDSYQTGEGTKYEYYASSLSYKKRVVDSDFTTYWLRSPRIDYPYDCAAKIDGNGDFGNYPVSARFAFSPAFCV